MAYRVAVAREIEVGAHRVWRSRLLGRLPVKAYCLIRAGPLYRSEAFLAGLRACGYEVRTAASAKFERGDLLVIWSRYWANHDLAVRAEAAGGTVLVAENAYLGGRHDGGDRYALALGYHNDCTVVQCGGPERWRALGIELKPWRADGQHILVLPNRPFGVPGRAMPLFWAQEVAERLQRLTKRPVVVRPHPGNSAPQKPLEADLAGAWACVVWSSSAGVRALITGIPVICEAPYWICKQATGTLEQIEAPPMPDRLPVMQRLAWAQWDLREIASGEAFRLLLSDSKEAQGAAAL